jgi:hypothetical protein
LLSIWPIADNGFIANNLDYVFIALERVIFSPLSGVSHGLLQPLAWQDAGAASARRAQIWFGRIRSANLRIGDPALLCIAVVHPDEQLSVAAYENGKG